MPLLQTTTAEGALKGMILARAPHQLGEQEVAYLQDVLLNQPGFLPRRGAITGTTAITAANVDSTRPVAVAPVSDPSGVSKIGIFYLKDDGAAYELWVAVYTPALVFVQKHYITDGTLGGSFPGFSLGRNAKVQVVPAIDGSLIISVRATFGRNQVTTPFTAGQATVKWYGGCHTTSQSGSFNADIVTTEGSTAVTGTEAEINKIAFPGVVINGIGVVASRTSTTQLELMFPAPATQATTTTSCFLTEMLSVLRARGRVSCTTGVLVGITGYGTKFTEAYERVTVAAGLGNGMEIFDATTMQKLAHITSDSVIVAPSDTVTGVPTAVQRSASLKNYLMGSYSLGNSGPRFKRFQSGYSSHTNATPKSVKGSWWATYKGLMVSFNGLVSIASGIDAGDINTTSRFWIHGPRFPEIMDHSVEDGDWQDVVSTKPGDPDGIAIQAGSNSVVMCKLQETFALRGEDTNDLSLAKIADDGALSHEATTSWRGMPIWMGKTGIWMYDGDSPPVNIVENTLGPRWRELVAAFDCTSTAQDSDTHALNQAKCFVYKDHLFVNITNTGSTHVVYTDGVARTSNTMQLMIYLPALAVTFLTNFNFIGFFQVGNTGYVILPQLGSTTHHIFPLENLFVQSLATTDTILTANSYNSGSVSTSVGPWFHVESRKYDGGDGLWRKSWKQLAVEFFETSTKRMWLETVAGLNTTGVRAVVPFTGTGVFLAARTKFRTRNQYMSFRLYEDIDNRPSKLILGAWQWGYKFARRGAV